MLIVIKIVVEYTFRDLCVQFILCFLFLGHLSYYGLASVVVRRALTSSSQELLGQSEPNLVCSICRVRRQEIVNFMTPPSRGGNFRVKSVKLMYFLTNLLLYSQA